MKKNSILAVVLLTLLPVAAFAAGTPATGASPQTNTSTVTVIIPAVVGIDIESNIAFDFSTYTTLATNCSANYWPPKFCVAGTSSTYDGVATHLAGASTPAVDTGAIWMAVFSSDNSATTKVKAQVPAAWTPVAPTTAASPGFLPTRLTSLAATNNNGVGATKVGNTTTGFFATAATQVGVDLPNTFAWSRADQVLKLDIPNDTAFNSGTWTASVTYTVSK